MTSLIRSSAVALRGVSKTYREAGNELVTALHNVTLSIDKGAFVVIVGHNGCGKSTLLNVISGFVIPDNGSVDIGSDTGRGPHPQTARVRQTPSDGVFDNLTVLENFTLFALRRSPSPFRVNVRNELVDVAVRRLRPYGMDDQLSRRVEELSQGQRQLLALELAMLRQPDVLLLDEHTASLDRSNAALCMDATIALTRTAGVTVLMVTHKIDEALKFGDTLLVMRDGQVIHSFRGDRKSALSAEDLVRYCGYMS